MNKFIAVIILLFCGSALFAQKSNQPVVAVDQLNVLYLGVDNPISIFSPVGFDQTTVTMTNGTITGSGSSRIVRPKERGEAVITIHAGGKITSYQYRVKVIPDPVFKVGSGKYEINLNEFKAQEVCRAEMKDFGFDIKYKVISATVTFYKNGFDEPVIVQLNGNKLSSLSEYMARCIPGTMVEFGNVKVQGPSGVHSITGATYLLN